MIRQLLLQTLALTAAIAAFAGEPNTLTPEEKTAGWKLLFDGTSDAGWVVLGGTKFPEKGWSVVDGALFHAQKGGGGNIVTTESYGSYELKFEWKIGPVGNSGVKYNLVDPKKDLGFEYQVIDDAHHPDGIRGGRLHQTGALYDLIEPPEDKKVKPVGEWNESRLLVDGNHVEQWLNGAKTVTFEIGSEELKALVAKSKYKGAANFAEKRSSPILLQDHGDEVAFRSLKIRVIESK